MAAIFVIFLLGSWTGSLVGGAGAKYHREYFLCRHKIYIRRIHAIAKRCIVFRVLPKMNGESRSSFTDIVQCRRFLKWERARGKGQSGGSPMAVIGQVFAFQRKSRLPAWILQNELHLFESSKRIFFENIFEKCRVVYNTRRLRTRDFVQTGDRRWNRLMDSFVKKI